MNGAPLDGHGPVPRSVAAIYAERVRAHEVAITDIQRVPQLIDDYAKKIDEIGMNPFKEFAYDINSRKAVYLPFPMAYPQRYIIDPAIIGTPEADKAKAACKYDAIDLGMQEEMLALKVGAIVRATGWKPYDTAKIQPYGYDRFANVITSVEFECIHYGPVWSNRRQAATALRRQGGEERRVHPVRGSRDGNIIRATNLEEIAAKPLRR